MKKKIAVIGGGISGLSAAQRLQEIKSSDSDVEITLFEKSGRLGGVIDSTKRDGYFIEGGPDCFVSEKPWALEMSRKVGIEDKILPSNEAQKGTFIFSKGKLHPLPDGVMLMVPTSFVPFATSTLFSWMGKIRMGMEFFIPPRKNGEADESLASFVTRRLGKEALIKIAEPLVAGIHAGDPETMSLKSSFPRFLQMEQKYGSLIKGMLAAKKLTHGRTVSEEEPRLTFFTSFVGCMTDLSVAIAESLKDVEIKLNCDIKTVFKTTDSRYRVDFNGGSEEFDAVIICAPAYTTARIIESLDEDIAAVLNDIPYSSSATISLAFDLKKLSSIPKGFGFVVPHAEKRKIMAATFSSIKWANRAPEGKILIRCFVGGAKNQELANMEDVEMERVALSELREIAGIDAKPDFSTIFRWRKRMPQYTVGHLERIDGVMKRLEEVHPGLYITGCAYYGVGIGDCIHNGWVAADKAYEHSVKGLCREPYEQSEDFFGDV